MFGKKAMVLSEIHEGNGENDKSETFDGFDVEIPSGSSVLIDWW